MPKPSKTIAIVTRRQDFQESSRLVQLVTRDYGRCTFLAKGAHRTKSPFLGAIDLLHVCEARVGVREGRGIQIVYGLWVIQGNRPFRRDGLRLALAAQTTESMRAALPEGRPDPELFDLFRGALALFRSAPRSNLLTIDVGIRLRQLQLMGWLPTLDVCPQTNRPFPRKGRVGFDPALGGFVAASETDRVVSADLPQLATQLLSLDGRTLGASQLDAKPLLELRMLTLELMGWHLGFQSRVTVPWETLALAGGARTITG